ncbi:MAG: HAMP domain-containing histidine kinase [Clostridia bacterium]|nr:HAMP domain-containing histidine kinase [Clostridia bacterium]
MSRPPRFAAVIRSVNRFLVFFLLVAFVTTCCLMLFITVMSQTMEIDLTSDNIQAAAKLTFANVILLSLACATVDSIRRKLTVTRPARIIVQTTQKLMKGDFTARVPTLAKMDDEDTFNRIGKGINRLAEELSGVETLRTDFVANVSHELKTPLAVIGNYAAMLREPGLSEEKRIEYSKAISDTSRRLANLITNILKLNKLENQQIFPENTVYDLGEQLCECLLQFEGEWEKKNIEIETDIAEDVEVCADRELLSLVWNNLLSNAFKFTDEGGRVSVCLTTDDTFATVSVTDTGCGMTPEVGAHIFEKFYQGDTSHATRGNGLGLALVKRVVDIVEGEISVESVSGKGSTFTVRIKKRL